MNSITQKIIETNTNFANCSSDATRIRRLKFKKRHTEVSSPSRSRRNILPPITQADLDKEVKTCKSYDPEYFSIVEGRPIKSNNSLNLYRSNIRNIALNRMLHGLLQDEILRKDRAMKYEALAFKKCSDHFDEYKKSFDRFLADDNDKTIVQMQKSDSLVKELGFATEEYRKISFEYASIKSKLRYLDENFIICLSIERFLHTIAPLPWQKEENIDVKTPIPNEVLLLSSDINEKYYPALLEAQFSAYPPLKLYFKSPEQLEQIFSKMEQQNLNYLLFAEEMTLKVEKIYCALDELKSYFEKEVASIKKEILEVEQFINEVTTNANAIKNMFDKILYTQMRDIIASTAVLKLETYICYTYEQVISTNEINLNIVDMAKALELEYTDLSLKLTAIDSNIVREIEKECYYKDIEQLKKAKVAHASLKSFEKIKRRLRASYEKFERSFY